MPVGKHACMHACLLVSTVITLITVIPMADVGQRGRSPIGFLIRENGSAERSGRGDLGLDGPFDRWAIPRRVFRRSLEEAAS